MSFVSDSSSSEESRIITTAVGIDKDKNSQSAVKWVIEKLRLKSNRLILVHVKIHQSVDPYDVPREGREPNAAETQQLFLPYRGFCARKGIRVKEVVLQGLDVASILCEYIALNNITTFVVGASSRGAILRAFKNADVPSSVAKQAPDFCKVYAVSKGKMVKLKASKDPDTPGSAASSTSRSPHEGSRTTARFRPQESGKSTTSSDLSYSESTPHLYGRDSPQMMSRDRPFGRIPQHSVNSNEYLQTPSAASVNTSYESMVFGSNFSATNFSGPTDSAMGHMTPPRQPSTHISSILQPMNNQNLHVRTRESPEYSMAGSSENSDVRSFPSDVSFDVLDQNQFSSISRSSNTSQLEIEDELRRLKQEMNKITLTYNIACQGTETARDKERGMYNWKLDEEENNLEESPMAMIEREKKRCNAALEVAEKAQRIAELESEKRKRAEMKFKLESEERKKAVDALAHTEVQYRRYTVEEIQKATNYFSGSDKIGEGGYGPVFLGTLDHTAVAIKVLRPDISQGEKQFQREVEVLSRMRHPNMVILLGACPEYGCLVYEYMDNGSLEDRLYRKNSSAPLSWQTRFRIAAEISTALNFLHRTRPEPLVHRDLKPANILIDRNNVSKISDVGLSRLVPPNVADTITQCCMTAAAGTFCYIDPEYQQTGMLGTKSDVYSLGIVLLQIITAKPAMGLTHHVESAIENDQFIDILDPTVEDWPIQDTLSYAKLALRCCELRRRDRPDLDTEILPELQRLRDLGSQIPRGRF
ncbi:hypothetical protein ACS0TY_035381 [Phlomoides rotata]